MNNNPTSGGNSEEIDEGVWDINKIEEKVNKPSQWGSVGAKLFKAFPVTHSKLPSGCYAMTQDNHDERIVFVGKDIKNDKIIRFNGDLTDNLLNEIDDFWKKENVFKECGFLHKRGYLLYGSAGTGKSSIVWQVSQALIDKGGVVFTCDNPRFFFQGLKDFRRVEPKRPIVCVFEDIDAIIKKYGDMEILSILDGDNQVNGVINIATTNYPEVLDKRINNRARRFDRVYKIEFPDDAVREAFLKEKLTKKHNVKEWMKKTEDLSFAALAETVVSVVCLGNDLDDTIKTLRDLANKNVSSSDSNSGVGFGATKNDEPEDGE
ncbi:MAG: AAA family ATPase [Candidatus Omnitrophota bacterium]|jgi:SpoVK/Ycf46/Vps4 family AAA+-type ATPase